MDTTTYDHDRRPLTQGALPRIGLAAAMALAAVNVLGIGAYATWTDTETDQVAIDSGTLGIVLGADGADNRLSVPATDIAPGDTISRAVTLTNDGTVDLETIDLSTSGQNGTALYTGGDRLDLRIATCSVPWTETAESTGGFTYTCSGTSDYVVGTGAAFDDIQQASRSLTGLASLTAGGVDYLVVEMQLPTSADNTYQGLVENIGFTFDAVQRDGVAK